jgi:prepilin-type processing-associated H-X9-DG protein
MTLIEVIIVVIVLGVLAAIVLPTMNSGPERRLRINCINNLKQISLAARVWEGDNSDKYPPHVSVTNGGSMEFITGPNAFRHFQVMSNELSTPKVVMCPQETDQNRFLATNFQSFCNSNISFFFGVSATETLPNSILTGDHNLTNGLPLNYSVLELTTNRPAGWTREMHNKIGNVAFSDGHVDQLGISNLQAAIANSGLATNRLQMPVLGP